MEEKKINDIAQIINELNIKYNNNPYMLQRLETHLFDLPDTLERENKKYNERITRINELTLEQDNFYKVFLSRHQYFYMPYNSIYYEYDGKTYKIIKDDDIHYQLLSTITDEGKLIQWKHKTKQNIIKKIKESSLFKSVPETYTIQNVLGFLQTIFNTKTEAKYFLTIIGDCILKKNNDGLLYFVSSNLKKCIMLIDAIVYVTTGNSIMSNFITKYHDSHKLNLYRLIKTNESTNSLSIDIVKNVLNNIGIDLLCVATHYSERYNNGDNYFTSLQNIKNENNIKNYVFYFVEKSLETIIDEFISHCIETVSSTTLQETDITWKNMHYIWKLYLSNMNIPNVSYSQQLQDILITKINNKNESGNIIFTNVTSKYLPNVSLFLSFWEKHITITKDSNIESNIDDEYEIDELMTLYKFYDKKSSQLTDSNMIKMICHYFSPHVEVINNKYITNIRCNLWCKNDDIQEFLTLHKSTIINDCLTNLQDASATLISFDELYHSYKIYFNAKTKVDNKIYLIVSKNYFEKFILTQLSKYVKFDKFVSLEWLTE
jgi:hypothetical protein